MKPESAAARRRKALGKKRRGGRGSRRALVALNPRRLHGYNPLAARPLRE